MKDKIKTIIIVVITIVLTAGTTVAASIAISASNITIDSDKTDKTNVADALDDLYDRSENYCPNGKLCSDISKNQASTKKCRRAKVLHTETCNQTSTTQYCSSTDSNYNGTDIEKGDVIVYGNIEITSGELHVGDAFTCDVNGDGIYNEITERFYYVSDYYDTINSSEGNDVFDPNTAVLIYYSNIIISENTIAQNNTITLAYNSANKNYEGPLSLISHIPTTSQWSNVTLKNANRQIRSSTGTTTTSGGTITFNGYTNKVARLLTFQEIINGCGRWSAESFIDSQKCRFLLQNTNYAYSGKSYWLETPYTPEANGGIVIVPDRRSTSGCFTFDQNFAGVRPVIEVAKSDISY